MCLVRRRGQSRNIREPRRGGYSGRVSCHRRQTVRASKRGSVSAYETYGEERVRVKPPWMRTMRSAVSAISSPQAVPELARMSQKGGKRAYSGRLGKDRSLDESQHSTASPK
jgi:hypothetical protein